MIEAVNIITIVLPFIVGIYLVTNIILQIQANNYLIKILKNKETSLHKEFNKYHLLNHSTKLSDAETEKLLHILRNQILQLSNKKHKVILQKSLNRKNFYNQKQFALKIFSNQTFKSQLITNI